MGEYETLKWETDGRVVTITLDRPDKLNAMSWTMFMEIGRAFEEAGNDPEARCVVVTGSGRAFSSGADLTDPANLVSSAFEAKERMRRINRTVGAFIECPKPTIAKVTGVAAGAGCNLALGCDFVLATKKASFAELFVKRGLVVDFGGTWLLPRLLPLPKAKELAMLGDSVSAEEAVSLGLITRVYEESEIDEAVKDLTERLVALPPRAVAMIKENLNHAGERSLADNLRAEEAAQALMLTSEDTIEAVSAWIEKREPKYTGR